MTFIIIIFFLIRTFIWLKRSSPPTPPTLENPCPCSKNWENFCNRKCYKYFPFFTNFLLFVPFCHWKQSCYRTEGKLFFIILKQIHEIFFLCVCAHLADGNNSLGNLVCGDLFDLVFLEQI